MGSVKVHVIHVGNMSNKGTQGLLKSDLSLMKEVFKDGFSFSVSTSDVEGLKYLNIPSVAVRPPMVDIPYERADSHAERLGYERESVKYKASVIANLIYMLIQTLLSVVSATFAKVGLKAYYRADVLRSLKECDLVISCSDENFRENTSLLPLRPYWMVMWWSMLLSRTWGVLIAKFLGKSVIMFPNSIGPFQTWIGRFLSKLALNFCDCILIREPISYNVVNSLKIKSPKILTSDTTLILQPSHDQVFDKLSSSVIGVSPGFYSHSLTEKEISAYITVHADALDRAIEKHGFSVIFLPHYVRGFEYDDFEVCELIIRNMKKKDKTRIMNLTDVEDFKAFVDQMDMIISSKMHPAVLAASGYVPTVCVAYDQKQVGFFEQLEISDCIISICELSSETLLNKIDYVWNNKGDIRNRLKMSVPVLQKNLKVIIKRTLTAIIGQAYTTTVI